MKLDVRILGAANSMALLIETIAIYSDSCRKTFVGTVYELLWLVEPQNILENPEFKKKIKIKLNPHNLYIP